MFELLIKIGTVLVDQKHCYMLTIAMKLLC